MIELIIDARRKDLGGFEVGRVLPFPQPGKTVGKRMVGPFIFLDHMGPAEFQPGFDRSVDVRPHPHIGLSTVTYLFSGEITHRDSLGVHQDIRPGEVNWMTAGRGITHSERFERLRRQGGPIQGMQAWVALPTEHEEDAPAFRHHDEVDLPTYDSDKGLWARLIAGEAFGAKAKVQTHSPMFYVHWSLQQGAEAVLEAPYPERAAYVAEGAVEVDGVTLRAGQMAVFAPGDSPRFTALTQATVMLLGGEPIGERFIEWNFVSSRKDRIEEAKADWRAGRFDLPPEDDQEWIPLPEPTPPANPMS
jgi:redox-sensitive bicupin YhaK (pirin superfamily)